MLENRHGRRIAYMPKEVRDDLRRRHEQQDRYDRVEDYQNTVRGGHAEELTASSIDKMKRAERRTSAGAGASASQFSAHSRKSSRASSSQMPKGGGGGGSDGITIKTPGTVVHLCGAMNVDVQPGEDGGPAHVVINSSAATAASFTGAGRDSAYGGSSSKSSGGSRHGRSRGGSEIGRM